MQCGLCKATCPEKVISLKPQIDFRAATASEPHHQAGRAVRVHPLRQAVRRQEFGRARGRQARRPALDVQGFQEAARRHQDVRRLPRCGDGGGANSIPFGAPQAPATCAPPTIICASAKESSSANTRKSRNPDRSDQHNASRRAATVLCRASPLRTMRVCTTSSAVRTSVLEIAYEESGPADGAPVLLMHGWPYDVRVYDEVGAAAHGCRLPRRSCLICAASGRRDFCRPTRRAPASRRRSATT